MPWGRHICFRLGWVAVAGFAARLSAAEPAAAGIEFFERKLRPLLAENCFSCHGAEKQKSHLRLDSPAAIRNGGDGGAVIVPGQPEKRRNSNLAARIASYEMAFSMQRHAPEAVDLSKETEATRQMYGVNDPRTADFGRRCLLARRLVERGVRFIQLYAGGAHNDDNWDAHDDLVKNHSYHAGRTDQPIAGLIQDLKQRGLLDSTLIIWGGEFGRQPTAENASGTGRDHNSHGFTMWLAGGGVKGGTTVGETDELGSAAVADRCHVKDLHATALTQMGLDPDKLTYFYGGLNQKLVGVEGASPIRKII